MTNKYNIKESFKIDKKFIKYLWMILIVILVDHLVKLLVYHNFNLHEEIKIIGDWFRIRLELNDGTAFSNAFENEIDRYFKISLKLLVSLALLASLIYYINKRESKIILNGLALCFAGTIGNLIDRIFYGLFISNAFDSYKVKFFHGRVIDMFYFPMFKIKMIDWIPIIGGKTFLFFEPVFNISDLVTVIGATMTIIGLLKITRWKQNNLDS